MKLIIMMIGVLVLMNQQAVSELNKTEQLLNVDREFSHMSEKKGIKAAFDFYMDENAAMIKNKMNPIIGREAIMELFESYSENDKLVWKPLYAQISESEDLGYTYGLWTFSSPDSTGEIQSSQGHYITIWKKQNDGSWKYVFDSGTSGVPE